jgi:tetratricopeptide (TPR) repeat protein
MAEVLDKQVIMSYINEALRKLQKEKKPRYEAYDHIVSAPGKKSEPAQKWLSIIGILMVLFFASGMMVFLYILEDKRVPVTDKTRTSPVASTTESDIVKKPVLIRNPIVEKPQKKAAKVLTKQEIVQAKELFTQALDRQREGKSEEAKKLYRKVVVIDQYNMQAFNNLGVIYMGEKNYKRAIMRFNNALNIKHDYADAHYNLACLYAQKNDVSQSIFYLKNAIEFNPKVRGWAKNDGDLKVLADLPEFKKLMEKE